MKNIGRYQILEELGRGATGVVYKALDPTLGRPVAIKVLTLGASGKESTLGERDLFMREARAAGRLSHPGIVTIHDAIEDAETRLSYIVMEFIPGQTLESLMVSETEGPPGTPLSPLSADRALDLAAQIGEALDYAHRHDIIHRDLKPANILVTHDGRAKIADFGIAKIVARDSTMRTAVMMGTPAFMSPEQVTGTEVDARSDLFSLGIILYLMLTGQRPFSGDPTAVMFKIAYQDPATPSQINPTLSAGHDYLALRCLAKDRDQRYRSAREFLDDLDDLRSGRPPQTEAKVPLSDLHTADRTVTAGLSPVALPAGSVSTPGSPDAKRRSNLLPVLGAGALVATLALGGAWIWHRRPSNIPVTGVPSRTAVAAAPSASSSGNPPPASPTSGSPSSSPNSPALAAQPLHTNATSEDRALAAPANGLVPGRNYQLVCKHNLDQGTLTVSSGQQVVLTENLKGRKKGATGLFGRRSGEVRTTIRVPAEARELSLKVTLADGAILKGSVSAAPPLADMTVLEVEVRSNGLKAYWRATRPTP